MTNQEILRRAIEKAAVNGYKISHGKLNIWETKDSVIFVTFHDSTDLNIKIAMNTIIFSHSFAKAFWGEEPQICKSYRRMHEVTSDCDAGSYNSNYKNWQYHLQQMVLKEEPLKYLEKFL